MLIHSEMIFFWKYEYEIFAIPIHLCDAKDDAVD